MIEDLDLPIFAGMHLTVDPDDVDPRLVRDLCNVDINRPRGVVTPRAGSRSLAAHDSSPKGGHPSSPLGGTDWDFTNPVLRLIPNESGRQLFAIVVQGAKCVIHRLDLTDVAPGFEAASGDFSLLTDRVPSCALFGGFLYIAGNISDLSSNFVVQSTGNPSITAAVIPKPTVQTALAEAGAGELTGTYTYAYSFRDSSTNSRGPLAASNTLIVSEKEISVTVEGSDLAHIDRIDIWRTTDGGGSLRFLAEVANPGFGNTAVYADELTDDRLSLLVAPTRTGRVPTCRFVMLHNDRMLWACRTESPSDLNTIYFSEVGHPMVCDPVRNFLRVRPDDGDQITGLARLYNRAFVLKTRQLYELVDNRPASIYRIDPIVNEGDIGCIAHATICEIRGRLFFLGPAGLCMFDGASATLVSGPVAPLVTEPQLAARTATTATVGGDPDGKSFSCFFRNADIATEDFIFKVRFYVSAEVNPNDPAPPAVADEINSDADAEQCRINGEPIEAGGYEIEPGETVLLTVYPDALLEGAVYWAWVQAGDGTQDTEWKSFGRYVHGGVMPQRLDINWSVAGKFFALDYWPRHEYWLFIASAGSGQIDTRLILDYDTLDSETGPSWRRDTVHATAGIMIDGVHLSDSERDLKLPILGDGNGCIWAARTAGQIDHWISRETELAFSTRVGRGQVTKNGGTIENITLGGADGPEPDWSHTALEGERVVCRDAQGNTYTGVVVANSETRMTIGLWLEGRFPGGQYVDFALGGIDAHVETHLTPAGEPNRVKEFREVIVRGYGAPETLELETRIADGPEALDSGGSYDRLRRRRFADPGIRVGAGVTRMPVFGRGRYLGLRIGSYRPGASWKLSAVGLGLIRTAGRS